MLFDAGLDPDIDLPYCGSAVSRSGSDPDSGFASVFFITQFILWHFPYEQNKSSPHGACTNISKNERKEFGLREPLQLSMEEICRDIQLSFPSL